MRYQFKIEEEQTEWQSYNVLHHSEKDIYDIVDEAARLYFYGLGGWQVGWPLTFQIRTESGIPVVRASVFILTGIPDFEVIPMGSPI